MYETYLVVFLGFYIEPMPVGQMYWRMFKAFLHSCVCLENYETKVWNALTRWHDLRLCHSFTVDAYFCHLENNAYMRIESNANPPFHKNNLEYCFG